MITKKATNIILIIAGAILIMALVWTLLCSSETELNKLARSLDKYGYNLHEEDFFIAYDNASTSIAKQLEGKDVQKLIFLSTREGFYADIDTVGGVTVILSKLDDGVLTLYLLDGEIQLAFVETSSDVRGI